MSRPTDLWLNGTNIRQDNMPPVPQRGTPSPMSRQADRFGYSGGCLEAQSLDYYYGRIPNKLVEDLLRPHMDSRGSFLLRDSNTEPGVITISVVDNPRHIYHFKVNCTSGLYEVTDSLRFRSLVEIVNFFYVNEVPGRDTNQLKLLTPVCFRNSPKSSPRSPPRSPPTEPLVQSSSRPPRPARGRSSQANWGHGTDSSSFLDSRAPVPIPQPGTEPMYIDHDHVYCRAEDLKKSRIDEIMELCKISDQKHKKCTCGLYMEQSILVEDWMMHVDRPEGDGDHVGSGRVFFVNSISNLTLWELPERTMHILSQQCPDKYRFVLKLLQEGSTL